MTKDFLRNMKNYLFPNRFGEIHVKHTTSSTMDDAKEHAFDKEYDKNIFLSLYQTQGTGTNRREFLSEEGGLYLSVLFTGGEYDDRLLTMRLACAVKEAVKEIAGLDAGIKWVNDIFYDNKKLAGILVQSAYMGKERAYTISGIGLNVNQENFGEYSHIATSLKNITGKTYDTAFSASALINAMDKYLFEIPDGEIQKNYSSSCITIGKTVTFRHNDEILTGTATGISPTGALEIMAGNSGFSIFSRSELL